MNTTAYMTKIGADLPGFTNGAIAGIVAVVIVLIIYFIIRSIIVCKKKKASDLEELAVVPDLSDELKDLKAEIERIELESKNKQNEKFIEGAVYSLVLLQREGRLIDFLKENIEPFEDAQIGAAVRQIHSGCAKVLDENFKVQTISKSTEGENITLNEDFDPSEIRMSGNVPEKSPYNGVLRHKGWKVSKVDLPSRTGKINSSVVCPAEIEF